MLNHWQYSVKESWGSIGFPNSNPRISIICLLDKINLILLKVAVYQAINTANDLAVLASRTTIIVQTQLFSFAHNNKESLHSTWFEEGYLVIFPSAFREVVQWKSWANCYHRVLNHRMIWAGRALQRSLVHTLLKRVRLTSKLDQTVLGLTGFWISTGLERLQHFWACSSWFFFSPLVPNQNFPCFNTQLAERNVCLRLSYKPL